MMVLALTMIGGLWPAAALAATEPIAGGALNSWAAKIEWEAPPQVAACHLLARRRPRQQPAGAVARRAERLRHGTRLAGERLLTAFLHRGRYAEGLK